MSPPSSLRLTAAQWQALAAQATADLPNETCGFLAGRGGEVVRVVPVPSASPSPTAYRMEPAAQIQAMLAIEAAGLDLTAIYHSHPSGPPIPSPTDVANAFYPDSLYLILSPAPSANWLGRAFAIHSNQATEVPMSIT